MLEATAQEVPKDSTAALDEITRLFEQSLQCGAGLREIDNRLHALREQYVSRYGELQQRAEVREEMVRRLMGHRFFGTKEYEDIGLPLVHAAPPLPEWIVQFLHEEFLCRRQDATALPLKDTCLLVYLPVEIFQESLIENWQDRFMEPDFNYRLSPKYGAPKVSRWLLIGEKYLGGEKMDYDHQLSFLERKNKLLSEESKRVAREYRPGKVLEIFTACSLIIERHGTRYFNLVGARCSGYGDAVCFGGATTGRYAILKKGPNEEFGWLRISAVREIIPGK